MRAALLCLSLPLASAAHAFHRCRGWKDFGYARLSDHARERLDRSARWVRDLAALSEAAGRLPGLAAALTGENGGRPIGLVAASHIGKVASPESLDVWLCMARTHTVRELKAWTRRTAAAGSHWPVAEEDASIRDLQAVGDSRQGICLFVPAAVREAFAETLDLYRAVEGHASPVGEFVDSLIAEVSSGTLAGNMDLEAADNETRESQTRVSGETETTMNARARTDRPRNDDIRQMPTTPRRRLAVQATADLPAEEASLRAHARRWLQEALGDELREDDDAECQTSLLKGPSAAVDADARMRRLISLHDQIERQLAEVVTEMADTAAWRGLGYDGLDDYARRGLGWSGSTLYSRVQLVRRLHRLPLVEKAYTQGRIGRVAAQTIARLLTRETAAGTVPLRIPEATQEAWVERAAAATIKRLHDETRAVARLLVMGTGEREPLDDRAWHASLHRQAGTAQQRVQALTRMALAAPGPLLALRLTLERETAARLSRVLAAAGRDANLIKTFSSFQQTHKATSAIESAGRTSLQTFSSDRNAVPVWVALLALLQEFIETWDIDVAGRRPSAQRIYNRDGWRCMAPGCTSRRNLEVHHVRYRSQGGNDQPGNLACLCRFHHQMGEHGLLARVRGEAPLGLVWRLGRQGCGGRYRNELLLTASAL